MNKEILGAGVVVLDRRKKKPLHRQLYEGIRDAIHSGNLKPGAALPATRSLANQLTISRMTVINAYDQLIAEGYLMTRPGSGTFVSTELPDERKMGRCFQGPKSRGTNSFSKVGGKSAALELSVRGRRMTALGEGARSSTTSRKSPGLFSLGVPALDEFPLDAWTKIYRDRGRGLESVDLKHQEAAGWMPLRRAISEFTKAFRGVRCEPGQIFITAGTQQAIDITARMLLDTGDAVLVEDPGYWRAKAAFQANGATLKPLPVDANGASVRACGSAAKRAKMIYVTPSHQMPTGVTMSIDRRIELLDWAQEQNATIIEDDYDSVYSYAQPPIPSLQGLDGFQRTFYIGSLSKLLFPSLGLGYVIVPPPLTRSFEKVFKIIGRTPSLLVQQVVHDFVQQGHLERHMRRMRKLYEKRHSALVEAIGKYLPGKLRLIGADAGLDHAAQVLTGEEDIVIAQRIGELGICVQALSIDSIEKLPEHNGLVFGFGCGTSKEITDGIRRIAPAF